MESHFSLLVADDEPAMRRVLGSSLRPVGYSVEEVESGEAAVGAIDRHPRDLVLLDINMPGIGGIEACRRIRRTSPRTGIVMISVLDREDHKVQAFEAGADDYVTKPFRLRELLARLAALRRRIHPENPGDATAIRAGGFELDTANRVLRKDGHEVRLSQKEFDVLEVLMTHMDTPIPHARLLHAVWGPEYGNETEYLRTYIKHLRKKLEADPTAPQYILTEPWVGYRFRNPGV
jgi:two-component system KDP operon response regulator KdpE